VGQKTHPKGMRIGIIKDWDARWFATKKNFVDLLHEDIRLRRYIHDRFYAAGVPRVEIERAANRIKVTIHTAKPGMVIGKGGVGVENLRKELESISGKQVSVNIIEIKLPETDAQLVAESIAQQLEKRTHFRRAMKTAITRAIRLGAKGIRLTVSGRLGGAEIARRERLYEGTVPLHTLRADIDYGAAAALTQAGKVGVKVWIYKGDILPETRKPAGEGGD
jgi:small subunit ribosomal protein S3